MRGNKLMTLIILLFQWPHLSFISTDHLTSPSMLRKSTKIQISSDWSQNTQPEQRKKGIQAAGGWYLPTPRSPAVAACHQVPSALSCPILSSHRSRPNITDEETDLVVVLVPQPSLVLEPPAEKSLLLLPRETAAFSGVSPRDSERKEC